MKRIFSAIVSAAIVFGMTGCAKKKTESTNEASQRFFEAWMHVHHPEAEKTGLGIYILEDTEGTGETDGIEGAKAGLDFTDASYIFVTYTVTDLEGNISSTNDKRVAKQLGSYAVSNYYGPEIWSSASLPAGVKEMLKGMKTRGRRKAVIPGWLMDTKDYSTEQEYLDKVTDKSNAIYTIEVADTTNDIYRKQIEKIEKFEYEYTDSLGRKQIWKVAAKDTVYSGFYYLMVKSGEYVEDKDKEGVKTYKALEDNATIHINYTGSLLNGQVFDTTDEKTAKDNNIYSSSKTYAKTSATWSKDSTAVQLNSNSTITGFSSTICRMKYYGAKGIGVFYSALGYGTSGSGSIIPAYAPLVFEVNIEVEE